MNADWTAAFAIWGAGLSTVLAWARFLPRPRVMLTPWPAERPEPSQLEMRVVNNSSWPIEIFKVGRIRLSGKPVVFRPGDSGETKPARHETIFSPGEDIRKRALRTEG